MEETHCALPSEQDLLLLRRFVTLDPPHRLIVRRPRGKFFARLLHVAEAVADTRSCRKPLLCATAEVAPCADPESEAGAA